MSEPSLEHLSRFTPDAGTLDRDALLFAAGRASARPNRGWMTVASLLAGTQTLSLVLLWPHPSLPTGGLTSPVASLPAPPRALEPPTPGAIVSPSLWSARRRLLESDIIEDRPAGDVTYVDSGPPLRAFARPSSFLN